MVEKTRTGILKEMSVGEVRRYPKSEYIRWRQASVSLYCHGYNYTVRTKRDWDYVEVRRLSDDKNI